MSGPPTAECERHRKKLSAFADETLRVREWEQVGYHLAGCRHCRDELAAIRRVCSTLSSPEDREAAAPSTLSQRLQGIAGEHVDAPLYMAAGPACALPSRRRRRNRRMLQSSAAVMGVLASVLALALLVAPDPAVLANPVQQAREQYSLSTTAISVNEAVGAVLLAHERGAALDGPYVQAPRTMMSKDRTRITRATAADMLEDDGPTHSGVQRVWISDGESAFHVTDVQVDEVHDTGSSLVVLDASGNRFMSWFVPTNVCCEMDDGPPWTFWKYKGMDQVAGRWAEVIEAKDSEGLRVARWWVDQDGGLVLWSERYDADGAPTIISGFRTLTMGEAHLAEETAELARMDPVSSSGAKGWCRGLDDCPARLGGLPLVAHASSDAPDGSSMRLFYSDGFRGLSVVWQEGQLHGAERVQGMDAGQPDVLVWQAGDGVVSVATNGSRELLHAAVAELPLQEPRTNSLLDRLGRGLSRLAGIN